MPSRPSTFDRRIARDEAAARLLGIQDAIEDVRPGNDPGAALARWRGCYFELMRLTSPGECFRVDDHTFARTDDRITVGPVAHLLHLAPKEAS